MRIQMHRAVENFPRHGIERLRLDRSCDIRRIGPPGVGAIVNEIFRRQLVGVGVALGQEAAGQLQGVDD